MTTLQAGRQALMRMAQQSLIGLVQFYRLFFKAWLGNRCRFEPSCSAYALQALQRHGALTGGALSAQRLLRCHPWCPGGHDPVPDAAPGRAAARRVGLFTRFPFTLTDPQSGTSSPPSRKLP
jgi:uncharacterized protein